MQDNHPQASRLIEPAFLRQRAMQLMNEEGDALRAAADLHGRRKTGAEFTAAIQRFEEIHAQRVHLDRLVFAQSKEALGVS